jgi:hypothetical protein
MPLAERHRPLVLASLMRGLRRRPVAALTAAGLIDRLDLDDLKPRLLTAWQDPVDDVMRAVGTRVVARRQRLTTENTNLRMMMALLLHRQALGASVAGATRKLTRTLLRRVRGALRRRRVRRPSIGRVEICRLARLLGRLLRAVRSPFRWRHAVPRARDCLEGANGCSGSAPDAHAPPSGPPTASPIAHAAAAPPVLGGRIQRSASGHRARGASPRLVASGQHPCAGIVEDVTSP